MLLGGSLFYGREADASGLCRAKPSLRVPSGTGLPPGVASAVRLYEAAVLGERREAELSLRVEQQVEKLRLKESREPPPPRAVRGAARHSKAGVFSAKAAGVGPQEGLAKFGQFRRGLAKGAKTPWLRSLPTFCRITESRSPRGSSGGEERVIFSPRGLGPDGVWEAKLADPLFCPQARFEIRRREPQ